MVRKAHDKCSYVRTNCPDHEDGLFSYLQFYYCSLAGAKPVAFTILILWLSLLFSTIGIAASDFLCIDLSTLAGALGLSESLAGVTFLAFGNGSPDVFSTFAAMKSNSGSLAIGELLGAASFITSVVAGSMALVRPFKVARRSFVRDVGYFIVAVSFSMLLLADGRLHAWESAAMVTLYCFYVVLVVTWHWYFVRRRRVYERDIAARSHFHIPENQELEIEEAEDDDPGVISESTSLLHGVSVQDFDALERGGEAPWKDGDDDETRNRYLAEIRDNMHVYRPSEHRRNTLNPIRPSLVGALEFQSVVSSLQRSRSTHQNVPITLQRYTDGYDRAHVALPERDNISVASHPWVSRPSAASHLSPNSGTSSTRTRAVSADDATGLKLDTSVFDSGAKRPHVAITRPSVDDPSTFVQTQTRQTDKTAESELSPSSSGQAWRSPSPEGSARPRTPQLLAPPGTFHPPNYQAETPEPRSPLEISPRGTPFASESVDVPVESPCTTEVVSLLKTLGVILNISDSLLGLTVFAVGNSLGDLVADITVARLGYPVMALSACFGGPMLNILLGIGLGGLYMTLHAKAETVATDGVPYEITISKVLIISGATLLSTLVGLLVVVPLNKWKMDRKIGWGLVILWCISTLTNVIAEVLA
ncbi:hypothetical protein APSETT444_000640 [Aspergillus pseudonomiae]